MEEIPVDEDQLSELFHLETTLMPSGGYFQKETTAGFRRYALSCIEENSKCDAFVAYVAMNYFDRFVSGHMPPDVIKSNEVENQKLLVICCVIIASKLRNNEFLVDVFLKEKKLEFSDRDVTEMENHISNALQGRMQSITPMSFIEHFTSLLKLPPGDQLCHQQIHEIIVRAQADMGVTLFKPSVIAASAVLTVSSKLFPARFHEFKRKVSSSRFVIEEELTGCIEAMETKFKDDSVLNVEEIQSTIDGPFMNFDLRWTDPKTKPRRRKKKTTDVNFKRTLCPSLMHRDPHRCTQGVRCRYAHGEHDLQLLETPDPALYKKKICHFHELNKPCPLGFACPNKHGDEENSDGRCDLYHATTGRCYYPKACPFGVHPCATPAAPYYPNRSRMWRARDMLPQQQEEH